MLKMLNKKMKSKGFTLIELLVVIAIIGILSSVVLVSLNTARNKSKDSAVKTALAQIRSVAEMCYDDGGDYDECVVTDNVVNIKTNNGNAALTGDLNVAQTQINNASAYCIISSLLGDSGHHWCVDSNGASKDTGSAAACTADHKCPAYVEPT